MASYTVGASEIGVYAQQLTANTVDTVTISRSVPQVQVWTDGSAAVYVTLDGSTPTVQGKATFEIPAGQNVLVASRPSGSWAQTVKLISSGTPKYSVSEAPS